MDLRIILYGDIFKNALFRKFVEQRIRQNKMYNNNIDMYVTLQFQLNMYSGFYCTCEVYAMLLLESCYLST